MLHDHIHHSGPEYDYASISLFFQRVSHLYGGVLQVRTDEMWQRLCDTLEGGDCAQQVDLIDQQVLPVCQCVEQCWHQPAGQSVG